MRRSTCLVSLALTLGIAGIAHAGDGGPPAGAPVIVVETPPPVVETPPSYGPAQTYAQPTPQQVDPGYGYAPAPVPPPMPVYVPHVRWGFSILGGATNASGHSAGSASGFGGASGRIGVQINPRWGVYLNEEGLIGGYLLAGYGWATTVVFATAHTSVLGSYTVGNRLELALGPSVDSLSAVSVSATSSGTTAAGAYEGTAFGVHMRAALQLGRENPATGGRSGFVLSFDAHPSFYGGFTLTTLAFGLGADWY